MEILSRRHCVFAETCVGTSAQETPVTPIEPGVLRVEAVLLGAGLFGGFVQRVEAVGAHALGWGPVGVDAHGQSFSVGAQVWRAVDFGNGALADAAVHWGTPSRFSFISE